MAGCTLNDILAKIEQRLDELTLHDRTQAPAALDPLSEAGLYITNDRLLAQLYREYLDMQRGYIQSLQSHGPESALTEVAHDMAESAFCAMETRLIELREEKELRERVERLQKKQRESYLQEMQERQKTFARRGLPQIIQAPQKRTNQVQKQNATSSHFWALLAFSFLSEKEPVPVFATNEFARAAA